MTLAARIERLEQRESSQRPARFITIMRSGRDPEQIAGLSGIPFDREAGESWPDYCARAERYAAGASVFVAIARYRD